jgi:hypothetical protein
LTADPSRRLSFLLEKFMSNPLSRRHRDALIADVFEARRDLPDLASQHGLRPEQLADWVHDPPTRRTLAGLCLLADLQTQLMLSRYRQVAVTELIKQASGGDEDRPVSAEQARKACVELLKADLKRAEGGAGLEAREAADLEADAMREVESIRRALYGDDAEPSVGAVEDSTHPSIGSTSGGGGG